MRATPTAEKIRRAARSLLAREGEAAVTMRRVARDVGLTPMALYRHFQGREQLLASVADHAFAELAEAWKKTRRPRSGKARLLGLFDGYLDHALAEPAVFHFLFAAMRAGARRFPDDFAAQRSPTANLLVDEIGAAMERGELRRDDVLAVGMTLWAQAHGLIVLYQGGRFGLDEAGFRAFYRGSLGRVIRGLAA